MPVMTRLFSLSLIAAGFALTAANLAPAQEPDLPSSGVENLLIFGNGNTLSGTVEELSANGSVILKTPFSKEPMKIHGRAIDRLILDRDYDLSAPPLIDSSTLVTLSTGEVLPGEVTRLGSDSLQLTTPWLSDLTVPRERLDHAIFNLANYEEIYAGPAPEDQWVNAAQWALKDGVFTNSNSTPTYCEVSLPSQFIFRARVDWETKPLLHIGLMAKLPNDDVSPDHYDFIFRESGIEMRRYIPGRLDPVVLGTSFRTVNQFDDSETEIEIRVDLERRNFHLALDGSDEAVFHDPTRTPLPQGTGLVLVGGADKRTNTQISDIQITGWNARSHNQRTEGRGGSTGDGILDISGQRLSGYAQSIVPRDDGTQALLFMSDELDDVAEVPLERVSKLFFKLNEGVEAPRDGAQQGYRIILLNGGQLRASAVRLQDGEVSLDHDFLGEMTLPSTRVISILAERKDNDENE